MKLHLGLLRTNLANSYGGDWTQSLQIAIPVCWPLDPTASSYNWYNQLL